MRRFLFASLILAGCSHPLPIQGYVLSSSKSAPISNIIHATPHTVKIAVLDSGFSLKKMSQIKLCSDGHLDTTQTSLNDDYGHGTHVVGLIEQYAANTDHCIMILKNWSPALKADSSFSERNALAIRYAVDHGASIINYSGGGEREAVAETEALRYALDKGVIFVSAAGNNKTNLDNKCDFFPACADDRIIVVGSRDPAGLCHKFTNYGDLVTLWEDGYHVKSLGGYMSGTSMSTAIVSGKIATQLAAKKDKQPFTVFWKETSNVRLKHGPRDSTDGFIGGCRGRRSAQ